MLKLVKSNPLITSLAHTIGTPLVVGLAYHGSTAEKLTGLDNVWGKHIDAETFEAHLEFITRHYQVVPVSEIVTCLREKKALPRKTCFITFDDGYVGNYEVAYPLLKQYGAVASFYIATSFIETGKRYPLDVIDAALKTRKADETEALRARSQFKALPENEQEPFLNNFAREHGFENAAAVPELGAHTRFMSWEQMREMQAHGMEFGSHTHRHYLLARVSAAAAREELKTSKAILEKNLGRCEQFCYPNGHYPQDGNDATDQWVEQAGYSCALYMNGGAASKHSSPFRITRCGVGIDTSVHELAAILGVVGVRVRNFF